MSLKSLDTCSLLLKKEDARSCGLGKQGNVLDIVKDTLGYDLVVDIRGEVNRGINSLKTVHMHKKDGKLPKDRTL